jgi:hypothetical protein
MPTYKIARSLYEPVTIEVEGGATLETVPLTDTIKQKIRELSAERESGKISDDGLISGEFFLIFGIDAAELPAYSQELQEWAVVCAMKVFSDRNSQKVQVMAGGNPPSSSSLETMTVAKAYPVPEPVSEAQAEKNASKPGSETSQ